MNKQVIVAKWELWLFAAFFVLVGALADAYLFPTKACAGVTDDAAAVRRATEHIERLIAHHANQHGEYVP